MKFAAYSLVVSLALAFSLTAHAQSPAEYGIGLSRDEALQGWLSLYDGRSTFGWIGATNFDSGKGLLLVGGRTSTEFGPLEVRGEFVSKGTVTVGGKSHTVGPGSFHVTGESARGPVVLSDNLGATKLVVRPLDLKPTFNGRDLVGWQAKAWPRTAEKDLAKWTVEKGVIHATGKGALEYTPADGGENLFADLIVQLDVRTRARHTNGGLFIRNQPGLVMMGYEAQLHNRQYDLAAGESGCWTGSIDDRQHGRKLVSRDFEPFRMTVVAHGPHLATWVNGYQVTDWIDTRPPAPNPRQGLRVEPGTIQLQAHDAETDLEFHQLWVAELPKPAR